MRLQVQFPNGFCIVVLLKKGIYRRNPLLDYKLETEMQCDHRDDGLDVGMEATLFYE